MPIISPLPKNPEKSELFPNLPVNSYSRPFLPPAERSFRNGFYPIILYTLLKMSQKAMRNASKA
jgi:hypothetical protein